MNIKIQKVFLDKKNNIFLVDKKNVLYLCYKTKIIPFVHVFNDIKNCFQLKNYYFVHDSTTIQVFNEFLNLVIDPTSDTWITKNIDFVCYVLDNIIVTLENGEVYVNTNVCPDLNTKNDAYYRISLSHMFKYEYRIGQYFISKYKFEKIKIVDNILLAIENFYLNVFDLGLEKVEHIYKIKINESMFDEIYYYDRNYDIFYLWNGSQISINGDFFINDTEKFGVDNEIFDKNKIWLNYSNDTNTLSCFYDNQVYLSLILPLVEKLDIKNHSPVKLPNQYFTSLCSTKKIYILNNDDFQMIMIDNVPYIVRESLKEVVLTMNMLYFHELNLNFFKQDVQMVIDIDDKRPIIDQLLNTIPYLYRLNKEMIIEFNKINSKGGVISYGEGVTRHIFDELRTALDDILEKKFIQMDDHTIYNLGKLLYFCSYETNNTEKFCNLHSYFFFLLSEKSDYVTLLQKFKGNNFDFFYDQYKNLKKNPIILKNIDMDFETLEEYKKYIFSCDLTCEQKKSYENFVKGFKYFLKRNIYYNAIKKLPILYLIEALISKNSFIPNFKFFNIDDLDSEQFKSFITIFKNVFDELSVEKKSQFIKNVTGSKYYNGIIHVLLKKTKNNLNVMYKISTCSTELIIYCNPMEEDAIKNIMNYLTINDFNIIN